MGNNTNRQAEDVPHPHAIMRMIVNRAEFMKKISLSERQIEYYKAVENQKDKGLRSGQLAFIFEISIQQASTALSNLEEKGYLKRENIGNPTGGEEYFYTVAI